MSCFAFRSRKNILYKWCSSLERVTLIWAKSDFELSVVYDRKG